MMQPQINKCWKSPEYEKGKNQNHYFTQKRKKKKKLMKNLVKVTSVSERLLNSCPTSSEETLLCGKIKQAPKKGSEIQVRSKKNLSAMAFNPGSEFTKKLLNSIPGVFNTKILSV